MNYGQIAVDAFGNALGNAAVGSLQRAQDQRIVMALADSNPELGDTISALADKGLPPSTIKQLIDNDISLRRNGEPNVTYPWNGFTNKNSINNSRKPRRKKCEKIFTLPA